MSNLPQRLNATTADPYVTQVLLQHMNGRLAGMRSDRLSWWAHWAQLAENFLPRRYKWFVTPNQSNRGAQMNQNIVDETGLIAIRVLASGMLAGLTSPGKPWFRLGFEDPKAIKYGPVKNYLAECERRMLRILAQSNFYQAIGVFYHDEALFGSAAMIEYEDPDDVVRFINPCLGEFFFAVNERLAVDTMYREYTYTVKETVDEFGLDRVSESVRQAYMNGGSALTREVVICHAIEPNFQLWADATHPLPYIVAKRFKFREVFWEQGQRTDTTLRAKGYAEQPFMPGRWSVTSNDAYGSSPGMDALPAVRQLQIQAKRQGEAIDKIVRPPMNAHVSMKNEPKSILPGSVTYNVDMQNAGFKPVYEVSPQVVGPLLENIAAVQKRVQSICYSDLFMMISQLDTVRTATEIDARREEKLIQLGPVVERNENEVLDRIIERTFMIMSRRGLLPDAPPEIAGQQLQVQYVSMLAEAQRAAETTSIERVFATAGNLAAVKPEVLDNINFNLAMERYADRLSVDPDLIVPLKEVLQIQAQRQQQQQAAQQAQVGLAAVQGAQTLSQTDVGGGQNALQKMIQ